MITGPAGAGKSTLAKQLHHQTGLPLYHLDKIFFINHWVKRDYDAFTKLQQQWVDQDSWIIDGNSTKSYETRYARADVCIYINPGFWKCCWGIVKRWCWHKDPTIDDRAPDCGERLTFELFAYNWSFHRARVTERLYPLRTKYPHVRFIELNHTPSVAELTALLGSPAPS